jgi:hypothetical protein
VCVDGGALALEAVQHDGLRCCMAHHSQCLCTGTAQVQRHEVKQCTHQAVQPTS